jgi:predicted nucleic acid-binding protein
VSCFFDTSVLVAAFTELHPRHEASFRAFAAADREAAFCGAHTMAEVFAVMTRLPVSPPISPESALLFVGEIRKRLTVIPLDAADYSDTIERAVERAVSGGRIYDALLLRCAEKAGTDTIYTWNVKHFETIAPGLAGRIRTP